MDGQVKAIRVRETDELIARAASLAEANDPTECRAREHRVQDYRKLVARVNALTDTEMELALLAR